MSADGNNLRDQAVEAISRDNQRCDCDVKLSMESTCSSPASHTVKVNVPMNIMKATTHLVTP